MNWANRLTIFRIILIPAFVTTVLYHRLDAALIIFIVATVTDALDGYIARTFKQKTQLGAIMDPIADKLLIVSAFISLSMVSGLPGYLKMPIYVTAVVISRDALILTGALIIYLHNEHLEVKPTILGKVTTFFQMLTIISVLVQFVYSSWIWNITVFCTVASGLDYLRIGASQVANGKE